VLIALPRALIAKEPPQMHDIIITAAPLCIAWGFACRYVLIVGGFDPKEIDRLFEEKSHGANAISLRHWIGWLGIVIFLIQLLTKGD
jgi:hypothetical protein